MYFILFNSYGIFYRGGIPDSLSHPLLMNIWFVSHLNKTAVSIFVDVCVFLGKTPAAGIAVAKI